MNLQHLQLASKLACATSICNLHVILQTEISGMVFDSGPENNIAVPGTVKDGLMSTDIIFSRRKPFRSAHKRKVPLPLPPKKQTNKQTNKTKRKRSLSYMPQPIFASTAFDTASYFADSALRYERLDRFLCGLAGSCFLLEKTLVVSIIFSYPLHTYLCSKVKNNLSLCFAMR